MPEYGKNGSTINLEHLQLKFMLASEWAAAEETTILLAGEVGVEKDTHKFKVGDGTTNWKTLPYSGDPNVQTLVTALTTRVETAEGTITSHGSRLDALDGEDGEIAGLKAKDSAQDSRLDALDGTNGEIAGLKAKDSAQDDRLTSLEQITVISANPFRE